MKLKKNTKLVDLEKELKILEDEERLSVVQNKIKELKNKDKFILSNGKEVEMRKPKTRDIRKAEKEADSDEEKEIMLIGDLCNLTGIEIDDLDIDDYAVYGRKLATYFL